MPITLEKARDLVLQYAPVLEEELAPLHEAVGRCLTRDVRSGLPQPPFDRSPLDGYAVVAADIASATPESPVSLRVVVSSGPACPPDFASSKGRPYV